MTNESNETAKPITVAFQVQDKEAFRAIWDWLYERFTISPESAFPDWNVTAVSNYNEFRRVELIEEALEKTEDLWDLKDNIRDILKVPIGDRTSLEDVLPEGAINGE